MSDQQSGQMGDQELHNQCTSRLIELANKMKDEGAEPQLVSAALMAASGIYATYVAAGNAGGLEPSGADKIVALYRPNPEHIQRA